MSKQHENAVTFAARQVLDIAAPSNFIWTNPSALNRTFSEGGINLMRGFSTSSKMLGAQLSARVPLDTRPSKWGKRWR